MDIESLETRLVESYERMIVSLIDVNNSIVVNDAVLEDDKTHMDVMPADVRASEEHLQKASRHLQDAYRAVKDIHQSLLKMIEDMPVPLVSLPCSNLNTQTYKESLLRNIRDNLELLADHKQ